MPVGGVAQAALRAALEGLKEELGCRVLGFLGCRGFGL